MRKDVFTPAAFEEKPTTIAVLSQRKGTAPPTGIPAWTDIFGESLQRLLQEVPCTSEGPYLYLTGTTQVSALIYLADAASCCASREGHA